MPKEILLTLSPKQAADSELFTSLAAKKLGVKRSQVALARVLKRSIDARRGAVKVNLKIELYVDEDMLPAPVHFDYPNVSGRTPVIIVGAGPAGLFCALRLIELGLKPVIVERGKDVSSRKVDIANINRGGEVDRDSNYAYGEGGAGTFSDGKLFTRSKKRGDYNKALRTLVFHGASEEILYDAHPHIGTDKLPGVIRNIRETIVSCGGEIFFSQKVTSISIKHDRIAGVYCGDKFFEGAATVFASGHSADDIYELLHEKGVLLEAKSFAMGLRIEHPQSLIDTIQYRMPERGEYLPAAAYSLVTQVGGRGVYSFCMCPGGFIVPAMTSSEECVVNGMSPSSRGSVYANSAIVTEVRTSDFEHLTPQYGVLAGLAFRRKLEIDARKYGEQGQKAPAMRVPDFVKSAKTSALPPTSYLPGVEPTCFKEWMPDFIHDSIQAGLIDFNQKMKGFISPQAVLIGVESRTSTPVRIPRNSDTLNHVQIANLFPCAEGAGYAGGIISAALDGERVAQAIREYLG